MANERLALVTGTSSGIGAAVARQLLERGWHVIGLARRAAKMPSPNYRHLSLDLADPAKASAAIEAEFGARLGGSRWQRVGLVNNAAVAPTGRAQDESATGLAHALVLNVAMPLWLMGFLARRRPKGAEVRVVNISSGAAHRAVPGLAAYCASKAALRLAGMTVASEVEDGYAIYSYEPGVVDTAMQRAAREAPAENFPSAMMFRQFHAEGRLAAPELPAADVVKFLEAERAERFAEGRRT